MSGVLTQKQAELAQIRADLLEEEKRIVGAQQALADSARRLEAELREVQQYRQGIEQLLGQPHKAATRPGKPSPGSSGENTRQLQAMIEDILKAVFPAGLTTDEVIEQVQPKWPHGMLTRMRMGALLRVNLAITTDKAKWFWVSPEEPQEGAQET